MALSIRMEDAILWLAAEGGLGDPAAAVRRVERVARGSGQPFGALVELAGLGRSDAATFEALTETLLLELPSHGLRGVAFVTDREADELSRVIAEHGAAEHVGVFASTDEATRYLHELVQGRRS